MSTRTRRVLALVLWVVALLSVIASSMLLVNTPVDVRSLASAGVAGDLADRIAFLSVATMGTVILLRRPDVRYGWVLLAAGLGFPIANLTTDYAVFAVRVQDGLPGGAWAGWLANWTWLVTWVAMPFSFLLFPDGRLPSHRWRPFAWWAALVGAVAFLLTGFTDIPLNVLPELDNPGGIIPVPDGAEGSWFGPVFMALLGTALISIVSLVVRFVGSRGDERQQLKWLVFAASLLGAYLVMPDGSLPSSWTNILGALTSVVLGVAIGVAVLKYRLYDIDVVISKTVVFAGLAGFITAIYVGIVVGVGTLLGAGGEPNLALSIVATGVVAVAFQPVRERLTRLANRLVFGQRATPYEVLSTFSSHLAEVTAPEQTLERMARLLVDGTGAARAQVWLRVAGELQPAATWPSHATDGAAPEHLVDVVHEGEVLGALSLDKQRGETLTPTDIKLVDDLAAQAGLVLRNLKLTEDLKARIVDLTASRQRLVAAQDAERRRLERDLHDGAQHQLTELKTDLVAARTTAEREKAVKAGQVLDQLTVDADDAVTILRELAHGIYPPLLAAEGLAGALTAQAAKAAVPVVVEPDGIGRYPQDIEAAVYFCVLEAVNNAAKYASPSQVTVRLAQTNGQLTFQVSDDGDGFDPTTTPKGHGTTNMTDRLEALNGQLELESRPGEGTVVRGRLPVRSRAYEMGTNR